MGTVHNTRVRAQGQRKDGDGTHRGFMNYPDQYLARRSVRNHELGRDHHLVVEYEAALRFPEMRERHKLLEATMESVCGEGSDVSRNFSQAKGWFLLVVDCQRIVRLPRPARWHCKL